jgi:hypothetical protein
MAGDSQPHLYYRLNITPFHRMRRDMWFIIEWQTITYSVNVEFVFLQWPRCQPSKLFLCPILLLSLEKKKIYIF